MVTTNGDRLVGEIKNVEKDVLTFSTAYSDVDFKIEWEEVASIRKQPAVPRRDVRRQASVGLVDAEPGQEDRADRRDERAAGGRVGGRSRSSERSGRGSTSGLDFGYSMTRANSAKQLSLGANLSYRDEHHVDTLFANVFSSSQENAPDDPALGPRRTTSAVSSARRWYVNTTQDFLNSEEQGLDLRTTIGGGGGRYLMRSSSQHLAARRRARVDQ